MRISHVVDRVAVHARINTDKAFPNTHGKHERSFHSEFKIRGPSQFEDVVLPAYGFPLQNKKV